MTAPFLLPVAALLLLRLAVHLWLDARQARAVARGRDAVPAAFAGEVSAAEHQRAADYTEARLRAGAVATTIDTALDLAWLGFGFALLARAIDESLPAAPPLVRDLAFLGAWAAVGIVAGLPVRAWRVLGIERRFGFRRGSAALFALDLFRSIAVGVLLGGPLAAGLLLLARHGGPFWWLAAWAGMLAVMLAGPLVATRIVMPLFNRFTPLADRALAGRLERLLVRCGFRPAGLFAMDASRRSSHANAFFTGFGRTRRIVLFDTLLERHTPDEIEAVVAHELGHFRLHHVPISIAANAATSFATFLVLGWAVDSPTLLRGLGLGLPGAHPALALLAANLVLGLLALPASLAANALSRRAEFQADAFARREVGAAPMAAALLRLSRDGAATLTPDPLYVRVHASHPPVPERIARLLGDG